MRNIVVVLLIMLISGCSSTRPFDFKPGFYEAGHPMEDALWEVLRRSSVTVTLSGHAGISFPAESGKGWESNISIEWLKARLKTITNRQQATILEEKNFTGQDQLDKKVVSLLRELGFKVIIIQVAHSFGTIIEDVIRN